MSTATTPARTDLGTREPLRRTRLAHPAAFVAVAATLVLFMAASSAPSPLYVVYQHDWGFSATTLTVVFAVYVAGLLGSLLVVGALSDHVGRRPVLLAAVALEAVALGLFLGAGNVTVLAVARVAQGIATGAAMTTLGAALADLNPAHAPTRAGVVNGAAPLAGLALGSLGCGALVQYAPAPTHLVYAVLLAGVAAAAVAAWLLPETSTLRPGARASLRPRVAVPPRLRLEVLGLVPVLVASWALGGLYLSLGPSVAVAEFGLSSHLVGGLVVTLLCGVGAVATVTLRGLSLGRILTIASGLLLVGMLVTLGGFEASSDVVAAVGTVVAGVGFGAAALGGFGTLARIAAPEERGELFAAAFVISYVAFSVPAVAAGFATTSFGLHPTVVVYGAFVAVLALSALVVQGVRARR
ncbi:putative MFS family arabinose efflux permease [Motilibacter peucedani]|uniref:Putative MFS family arabinose efflux permease n=1 Tax=Motilibacter peucedani TaxID=598650 RepID=A0A420XPP2_9ACTN|nr:MFS transporter [Motilibacter peucedani]RKS75238.1 putative MFS family arabinose efflux permease [Motilibacter peucedani]